VRGRDPGVEAHYALYPLRLRVVESHNVTRPQVTCWDVFDRHVPTVGGW
jgi:hypothetical protein